jgi:hypothetical protein
VRPRGRDGHPVRGHLAPAAPPIPRSPRRRHRTGVPPDRLAPRHGRR